MRDAQQARPPEIAGPLQLLRQPRRAHRHQIGREQRLGDQARPLAVAELDAAAPVVAERRRGAAGGDAHLDVGFVLAKIRQPRDQPAHGKGRTDADGQHPDARRRGHLRGQARQRIEDRRQPALIGAPRRRHRQPVGLALEQRDAEPLFQQMHHPGDRRRRDVELGAGAGKAAGSRRGLERLDAVEKEQPPHFTSETRHPQEN